MRKLKIQDENSLVPTSTAAFGSAAFGLNLVYVRVYPEKSKKEYCKYC